MSIDVQDAYRAAIARLNEVIRRDPENARAYYQRGICYRDLMQDERALADLDNAIRLDPDDADALLNRGYIRANLKRYEQAIRDFSAVSLLRPDDALAYQGRVLVDEASFDHVQNGCLHQPVVTGGRHDRSRFRRLLPVRLCAHR